MKTVVPSLQKGAPALPAAEEWKQRRSRSAEAWGLLTVVVDGDDLDRVGVKPIVDAVGQTRDAQRACRAAFPLHAQAGKSVSISALWRMRRTTRSAVFRLAAKAR